MLYHSSGAEVTRQDDSVASLTVDVVVAYAVSVVLFFP
jgi:hypothetical protein